MDRKSFIARERVILITILVLCGIVLLTGGAYRRDFELKEKRVMDFLNSKGFAEETYQERLSLDRLNKDYIEARTAHEVVDPLINRAMHVIVFGYLFLLLVRLLLLGRTETKNKKIITREIVIVAGILVLCGNLLFVGGMRRKDIDTKKRNFDEFLNSKTSSEGLLEKALRQKGLLQLEVKAKAAKEIYDSYSNRIMYMLFFGYLFSLLIRFNSWDAEKK